MTRKEEAILRFGNQVLDFLVDCGGPYKDGIGQWTTYSVFYCLGAKQFVIKIVDKKIKWFACYWKISKNEIEAVSERMRPADLTHGDTMYVVACGCKDRAGLAEIRKELRKKGVGCQGVFWHRPVKEDKVFYFPRQKGVTHG